MRLTDQEFRDRHKPLQVPSSYEAAANDNDRVVFALADIGEGTAEAVVTRMEQLNPAANHKLVIATVHKILSSLYGEGLIAGNEKEGDLVFNLHKITSANDGAVNPNLLAPGLD